MAPDIFKLLMQGQAPAMDNSASQGLNQQALELMMQAQSQPQAQIVSKPNTESILLSLLPAALGAGTDYIGSLGKSYLQGQQNEMARIDRQSQLTANQLMAQAKALSSQAGDMQDLELAQFNQANQNVRNAQNNLRMNAITQANNQTRSTIAGNAEAGRNMRFRDTNEGKVIKSMVDPLVASIKQLVASSPWDEKSQAFTDAQVNSIVQQFPQYAEKIRAMVPKYPLGFKSKDVLGTENRNRSMDMKAMSTARQMYYDGLKLGARTGYVGKDDIAQADDLRQTIAEAFTISPDLLALPQEGKAWQLIQAEATAQLRRDEFNYKKEKDAEETAAKLRAIADEKTQQRFKIAIDAYDQDTKNSMIVTRYEQLVQSEIDVQKDLDGETDPDKVEVLNKKLAYVRSQLDASKKGSIAQEFESYKRGRQALVDKWTNPQILKQVGDGPPGFKSNETSGKAPASIRSNNPGAMWHGAISKKWGATGKENLKDGLGQGNNVAVFKDPIKGAAAQIDLLSTRYTGMPLRSAIAKWSGGNNVDDYMSLIKRMTGLTGAEQLTKAFMASDAGLRLAKAMAHHEAGQPYPLDDEQWRTAQQLVFANAQFTPQATPSAKPKAKSTQKSDPKTNAPSAPKQFSVGGTTFKKLS